jgi:hypothetical protein
MAATITLVPAGERKLAAGQNKIATLNVSNCSSIRVYAHARPNTPQVEVSLRNADLAYTGIGPEIGALGYFLLDPLKDKTVWYPLPGTSLSVEVWTSGPGWIDLCIYGQPYP